LNASLNGRALFAHDVDAIGDSPTIGQAWIGFQADGAAEVRFDDLEIVGR
jgi:hypothetical protein